jgi:glucose-1-phosphate thymidylyltransferase
LKPSRRGELEITDLNRVYLESGNLDVVRLGRGFAWLDTGTPASLLEASQYVHAVEQRQGQRIACLEEIAHLQGWIDGNALSDAAERLKCCEYGNYLLKVRSASSN